MSAHFANPVPLPCFVDGERKFDIWSDGLIYGQQFYDGLTNKVEITPSVRDLSGRYTMIPVGQSYTIGERHLTRLICEANQRKQTV